MSFTDRLLLWLHIGFAIFTLGPVTAAMMATPRYIRTRDLAVLRYLCRTTGIFGLLTIGVFLFGLLLGRNDFNQAWLSASMTLFIVSAALLVLVFRDQRRAISAIAKAIAAAGGAGTPPQLAAEASAAQRHEAGPPDRGGPPAADPAGPGRPSAAAGAGREDVSAPARQPGARPGDVTTSTSPAEPADQAPRFADAGAGGGTAPGHVATVERGRIATMAGVISAIWLAILVLMVWHG